VEDKTLVKNERNERDEEDKQNNMEFKIYPIGVVKKVDEKYSKIILDEKLIEGLDKLEEYSHIIIMYYLDKVSEKDRKAVKIQPHHHDIPVLGIFATRFPARPNPIGLHTAKLIKIEGNILIISKIDAEDDTPLIDIKPYIPKFDRPDEKVKLPGWVGKHRHHADKEYDHEHEHSYAELRKMIVEYAGENKEKKMCKL